MSTTKEEAIKLITRLPDEASWDDIMYEMYVKKKIELGIKASDEGRVLPHEEVKGSSQLNEALLDRTRHTGFGRDLRDYIAADSDFTPLISSRANHTR